jgi:hypothetical protein
MGRTTASKTKSIRALAQAQQRHKMRTALFVATVVGGAAVSQYVTSHLIKTPMYNSTLSGQAWLQELLSGHPVRFHDNIGMSKHVFRKLVHELQMYAGLEDSKHVTKEEQLAIFLHLCRTGAVTRDVRECFQRGPETISKCVLVVLVYFLLFSEQF